MTSLKGNLNSVDLANIFQMLALNQSEGTLYIFDGASRKAIYFGHDGVSVLSTGNTKMDSLGRVLMRHDRLSPEQLQEALRRQQEAGNLMLGQVLVEQGLVTRQEVEEALQIQIEEEIYNLFIWKDASFEFVEGPASPELAVSGIHKIAFNVNSLIMEAAQRVDEWQWIQTIVTSLNGIYRYSGRNVDLDDPIFQESYAGKVLNAIDGRRSVEEIIEISNVNCFEVCKITSLLTEGGAVEPVPVTDLRKEADEAIAAADTATALKFLTRIVELEGDTPEMHKQLAEVYEGEQEIAKAVFHYKVYAEVLADTHKVAEAFGVYHRIVTILPTDLSAADRMIEIFSINTDGLEEHAQEIIDQGKLLAECYMELGRSTRAIAVLHRVVSLGSDDHDLRNRLITVYIQSGMSGEAIAEYEAMAEAMASVGELQEAAKVYRKILTIDSSREDVKSRLNQVLSKSRRRQRNLKAAALTLLFLCAVGTGAWYFLKWYKGYQESVVDVQNQATAKVAEVAGSLSVVLQELESQVHDMRATLGDPDKLATLLQAQEKMRGDSRLKAQGTIQRLAVLREEYPDTPAAVQAENHTQSVEALLRLLDKLEGQAIDRLTDAAKETSAHAQDLHHNGEHIRKVLARLQRALKLSESCKGWRASEDGQKTVDLARNFEETIAQFDESAQKMEALIESGEVAAAFETGLDFLCSFPPPELAAEVRLPFEFRASPAPARVFVNGEDTGVVTPGIVRFPLRVGAEIELRAEGFAPYVLAVPAVTDVDPKVIRAKTRLSYNADLLKERRWVSKPLSGQIEATPALFGDDIVVPTRGSAMEILDLETGASVQRVKTQSSNGVQASALAIGDILAVPTINKVVLFYARSTYKYLGQFAAAGELRSDPAVAAGNLILCDRSGHVTAVDPDSRSEIWRFPPRGEIGKGHDFVGPALVVENEVYVALRNGVIYVLDAATGNRIRQMPVTNQGKVVQLVDAPTLSGENLYVGLRDGHVLRVDRHTGRIAWGRRVAEELAGAPVERGNTVYALGRGGKLVALSASDGTPVAEHTLPGRAAPGPALSGDILVAADSRGVVVAYDVSAGGFELLWRYEARASDGRPVGITSRPFITDGAVLVGTSQRTVHAIER